MTLSQLALICAGITINALTFALGICVGVSLSNRKDSGHGYENAKDYWHSAGRK